MYRCKNIPLGNCYLYTLQVNVLRRLPVISHGIDDNYIWSCWSWYWLIMLIAVSTLQINAQSHKMWLKMFFNEISLNLQSWEINSGVENIRGAFRGNLLALALNVYYLAYCIWSENCCDYMPVPQGEEGLYSAASWEPQPWSAQVLQLMCWWWWWCWWCLCWLSVQHFTL